MRTFYGKCYIINNMVIFYMSKFENSIFFKLEVVWWLVSLSKAALSA